MSYKINDHVMYRRNGICRITDIREEAFSGNGKRMYYVMDSVYDKAIKFYVPYDLENIVALMRPILTKEEIISVIEKTEETDSGWIEDDDERSAKFEKILAGDDITEILWLVKILSLHKIKVKEQNKKFHACDERLLAMAEKVITDEFAFVLDIKKKDVISYIVSYLRKAG